MLTNSIKFHVFSYFIVNCLLTPKKRRAYILYSQFISLAKRKQLCKIIYSLYLYVDYIYKLNLYLLNTILIYKYIIIVDNK